MKKIIGIIFFALFKFTEKTGGIKITKKYHEGFKEDLTQERLRLIHPFCFLVFIIYLCYYIATEGIIKNGLIEDIKDEFCIF